MTAEHQLEELLGRAADAVEIQPDLDSVFEGILRADVRADPPANVHGRVAALVGVVAVVAAGLVAVAGTDDRPDADVTSVASSDEESEPSTPAGADPSAPRLPIAAFGDDERTSALIARASDILTGDCLESEGLSSELPPELASSDDLPAPTGRATVLPVELGVTDERVARERGYAAPAPNLDTGSPSLTQRFGAAYLAAFSECTRRAGEELRGDGIDAADPAGVVNVPGRIAQAAAERTRDDPRVSRAIDSWSACMERKGFDYDTPEQPPLDFPHVYTVEDPDPVPPTAAEAATARADVDCKHHAALEQEWFSVERLHQKGLIEERAGELAQYVAWRDGRTARAERIVAGR